ncbi:hypothetical protein CXT76_02555 [Candidatus Parvarchaeota archaeon]|jgi:hypothetical protein|nr:MAG: hypothetical protein CXT76_02555 [Candidatus Parvarchaeota archaeon]
MKNKPNVLVAGFPKSGSTFLYHILKQHPDIFIPKIKELNYFNKDNFFLANPEILNPRYFKSENWYYSFFRTDKKVVIDFSILSALDITSAKRAKKLLGDPKIIFIIRNKEDYFKSMRKFIISEGGNPSKNLKDYLEIESYIENYKNNFSKILIVSLEKINKNPEKELFKLTNFLSLKDYKFNLEVPRHETRNYKMKFINLVRRKLYILIVNLFYKFLSFTVSARIKAAGESK